MNTNKKNKQDTPEIKIALFGQSGSGKTTFLSSYYGNQQRTSFEEHHKYRLEAEDTSVGNGLLAKFGTYLNSVMRQFKTNSS